jgi:hypothetical protein
MIRMRASQLISIGVFTAAVVLTLYAWSDRIRSANGVKEGFDNPLDPLALPKPAESITVPDTPTDADAVVAHKILLLYTTQNLEKGLRFIKAIGRQFFEPPFSIRTDINPLTLTNNYMSPLQIV